MIPQLGINLHDGTYDGNKVVRESNNGKHDSTCQGSAMSKSPRPVNTAASRQPKTPGLVVLSPTSVTRFARHHRHGLNTLYQVRAQLLATEAELRLVSRAHHFAASSFHARQDYRMRVMRRGASDLHVGAVDISIYSSTVSG